MPLDAIFLTALCSELSETLVGARIDKVQQPERNVLVLSVRGNSGAGKLLINASPGSARINMTEAQYENPAEPPMFCMLMRKHLVGARITGVTQIPSERILTLVLDGIDTMGDRTEKRLTVELMGRFSNVILLDGDGVIIDCMRRMGDAVSGTRHVLPGLKYRLPEQEKNDPFQTESDDAMRLFSLAATDIQADKRLLDIYYGLSPLICRELIFRAYGRTDFQVSEILEIDGGKKLENERKKLINITNDKDFTPILITDEQKLPKDFSFLKISHYEGKYTCDIQHSFSQLLDGYYMRRDKAEYMRMRAQSLTKTVKTARDRTARRLSNQYVELKKTAERETWRENGDLIMSNLYAMKRGQTLLRAEDYYSENGGVREIKLDPLKTPQQNAAMYYRDYNKAKTAERVLSEQTAAGEQELSYLESVLAELPMAENERDLSEIRQELTELGYIKAQNTPKKVRRVEQQPMLFKSSAGLEIIVGKNNSQNDKMTWKTALKSDVWLHAHGIHGSHVIIRTSGGEADEASVLEAASLAAYYSQGRQGGTVPVDVTLVRHVKKPAGAKPGMVIYTDYRTVFVKPNEELADRLRIKQGG